MKTTDILTDMVLVELRSKPTIEKELDLSTVPQPPSNASQTMNRGGRVYGCAWPKNSSIVISHLWRWPHLLLLDIFGSTGGG